MANEIIPLSEAAALAPPPDCPSVRSSLDMLREAAQQALDALESLTDERMLDIADSFKSQYMHGGTTFDEFDLALPQRDRVARIKPLRGCLP